MKGGYSLFFEGEAIMGIGFWEIILIVAVIVLLFGATQIPKIARSLGEGLKEFKKAVKDAKEKDKEDTEKQEKEKTDEKKD